MAPTLGPRMIGLFPAIPAIASWASIRLGVRADVSVCLQWFVDPKIDGDQIDVVSAHVGDALAHVVGTAVDDLHAPLRNRFRLPYIRGAEIHGVRSMSCNRKQALKSEQRGTDAPKAASCFVMMHFVKD